MKNLNHYLLDVCIITTYIGVVIFLLIAWQPDSFGDQDKKAPSAADEFRMGERMYREGILPSGKPIKAIIKGTASLPGTAFGCESCHLRSGLGSTDNNLITPPTSGAKLFKPQQTYTSTRNRVPFLSSQFAQQKAKNDQAFRNRPIYTEESLAKALREGIDSAGRMMNDTMPRYFLDDGEMKILISYLKKLSSELSPGVSDTELNFATIITDGVSSEDQNAMLSPLENFVRDSNAVNFFDPKASGGPRSAAFKAHLMAAVMRGPLPKEVVRKLTLSRWVLKGPPETWRNQLEEYYRKGPVFAILGGITNGTWQPIHQFCEANRIPNIFPITDYPVISSSDWYTLYFSKGYYQEGEGAAGFLKDLEAVKGRPIVQIVRDSLAGRALAGGFRDAWLDSGQKMPKTLILDAGEILTAELLQKELAESKLAVLVLWDGPTSLKALELIASEKDKPEIVLLSSSLLEKSMLTLPETIRNFAYLTYPYGITQRPEEKNPSPMVALKTFDTAAYTVATNRIAQQSYILTVVLNMALTEMKENYYRDNFLDLIGAFMELDVPLYDRLSFGSGQRYASRGCYIVQVAKSGGLVKKSGWLIH